MTAPAPGRPLARLWRHAGRHRGSIALATLFSVLNKLFDLAPPMLIGAAVDIVVKREDSMAATIVGPDITDLKDLNIEGTSAQVVDQHGLARQFLAHRLRKIDRRRDRRQGRPPGQDGVGGGIFRGLGQGNPHG